MPLSRFNSQLIIIAKTINTVKVIFLALFMHINRKELFISVVKIV